MRRVVSTVACAALFLAVCGGGDRILVAAGTTLVDSGAMAALSEQYRSETGVDLSVVGVSSREALLLLEAGEADLAITHHPEFEARFAEEHPDFGRVPVLRTSFVLAGPDDLARRYAGLTIESTMAEIAGLEQTFVSRNDGSGTAAREAVAWVAAGVDPAGMPWHVVTGSGMGPTLQVADQRGGFVFVELGALLGAGSVELTPVATVPGSVDLVNRYTLWSGSGEQRISDFADWLVERGPSVLAVFAAGEWGREVYTSP